MQTTLEFDIHPQPDDTTCGPTCLDAVYRYYGDELPLDQVIREAGQLDEGGTLAVLLGTHALRRGYRATIYTYNLHIFDPTWFPRDARFLADRLRAQTDVKTESKLASATAAYLEFLRLGGTIQMADLTSGLFRRYLKKSTPILTGLSATYLYQEAREIGETNQPDDIRGTPTGHFVVLCGYDKKTRRVMVADPLMPNPLANRHLYEIEIDRVRCAILLGIVTYDANLLIVEPASRQGEGCARSDRRQ